jgi:hypothetical protein
MMGKQRGGGGGSASRDEAAEVAQGEGRACGRMK